MVYAKKGDTVTVHYTGRLTNGSVFDSSQGRTPIKFTIGKQEVIPGFEDAVLNLKPGDKTTITIPCDQAYGKHRKELVITVPRSDIPEHIKPEVGQVLQFQKKQDAGGKPIVIPFTVIAISDIELTLDANHPLSDKDLIFDIELVEIL